MGYQLKGIELELSDNTELISSAISFGTIQLLPGTELMVLMADHQTAGAFPRLAHVVSAHLPKLAQLRPSDSMQFKITDNGAAEELLLAQQKELQILQRSCRDRLNELVS
jgi:antagonist of KipI